MLVFRAIDAVSPWPICLSSHLTSGVRETSVVNRFEENAMLRFSTQTVFAATTLAALFVASAPCRAETVNLTATLKGSEETPPNDTAGTGSLTGTYDTETKKLTWSVTYSGLTGPATAAHFHGPAGPGKAAPVEVPATDVDKNPIVGSATLTDAQAKDLLDGNLYFNIHTAANKPGEIRGQVGK
jgi:hypothetical protein